MNSSELQKFKACLDVKEFTDFYINNGEAKTVAFYGLSYGNVRQLKKEFNIIVPKEIKKKHTKETWNKKSNSIENQLKSLSEKISFQEIVNFYEVENHTVKESAEHFSLSEKRFLSLLNYYNYHKSVDAHTLQIKKTKTTNHGNPNYNNMSKIKETVLAKYGVDNVSKNLEVRKKISTNRWGDASKVSSANYKTLNTILSRWGSLDNYYTNKYLKTSETCMQRYGVDNPIRLQKVKDKIAISVKSTFLDKYGVECFWQTPEALLNFSNNSQPNIEFSKKLSDIGINYQREFSLGKYLYDFKVGSVLIEINPTATHNSTWSPFGTPKNKYYHRDKSLLANSSGYRCINLWDWDDKDKVLSSLCDKTPVYARICNIKEVSKEDADKFLSDYHFQGTCNGQSVRLGLYQNEELIQIMTFGKPRYNNKYEWELLRLCTKHGHTVVGGASKLFTHFLHTYNNPSLISYCDMSKFSGDIYTQLGMKIISKGIPSRHWYHPKLHIHITDNLLRQRGFDQLLGNIFTSHGKGTSNENLMLTNGFVEVYDCGQVTYAR